jgi:diphosphomevalonate decarboxylase
MRAKAKAPANIAFLKYWGKKDPKLRLPMNNSISMNLSGAYSITEVEFSKGLKNDVIKLDGKYVKDKEKSRIVKHLDRVRELSKVNLFARVESVNNFPKGTGIASSASGFAALTLASTRAAGLDLKWRELSVLARLGSGSACRSIPDGFVEWRKSNSSGSSYAKSLYPSNYWDICDLIVIVGKKKKKVSSTSGHALAESSPFMKVRLAGMEKKLRNLKRALKSKDFSSFGRIIEEEAINMHAVMMTSVPPLHYWAPGTLRVIYKVIEIRERGRECYFTLDAGPNVHVICRKENEKSIKRALENVGGVERVITNYPAMGARLLG